MYKYEDMRDTIFTDEGQRNFLKIRDRVHALLNDAGAVTLGRAIKGATGDSWSLMACVDRLVELGEIREIPTESNTAAQHRVFVTNRG